MAVDRSLDLRRALLKAMKGSASLTASVPASSIYPSRTPALPAFPFIRCGAIVTTPFLATGLDSSQHSVTIHGFVKPVVVAGATVQTAEDAAYLLAQALAAALGDAILPMEGGGRAYVTWAGSNVIPDGDEADAWHAALNFRAEVAG